MWFSVGAKLLGVFLIYHSLIHTLAAVSFGWDETRVLVMFSLFVLLSVGLGSALAFRTERVARALGIESDAHPDRTTFEPGDALRTGIILIGLYIVVLRVGNIASLFSFLMTGDSVQGIAAAVVRELVPVAVGLIFVLRSQSIVELISRYSKNPLKPES